MEFSTFNFPKKVLSLSKQGLLLSLLSVLPFGCFGQRALMLFLFPEESTLINPAFIGKYSQPVITAQFYNQSNTPVKNQLFQSLTVFLPATNKVTAGGRITNSRFFVSEETNIEAQFAYEVRIGELSFIHLGLDAGAKFIFTNIERLKTVDDNIQDPLAYNTATFLPSVGVGIYFQSADYFASLAFPHLLHNLDNRFSDALFLPSLFFYFFSFGFDKIVTPDWRIGASLIVENVILLTSKFQLQASARYRFAELFINYNSINTMALGVKVYEKNFLSIGYATQFSTKLNALPLNYVRQQILLGITIENKSNKRRRRRKR